MKLTEKVDEELKAAMKARDNVKKLTLRGIKKEIIEAKTAPGSNGEVNDADVLKIIIKMLKQRKDSSALYVEQGRADLAENENAEAAILETFLPKQLSDEELTAEVQAIITKTGASSMKDMGKVMGMANKALAGKAEGRAIAGKVKELLG